LLSIGSRPALGPPIENEYAGYLCLHSTLKYGWNWLYNYLTLSVLQAFFASLYWTTSPLQDCKYNLRSGT